MINFEEEIAKRDARIAELVGVRDHLRMQASIQAQEARTQRAIVMEIGAMVGEPCDWLTASAVREALKAQQPSAGVACALMSALEGIVHDQRVPNEVSQECAAVLIEARRLNHCRAQAVPGWTEAVEACAKLCEERAAYYESGDDDAPGSRRGNACRHCADVIRYNLTAAPSSQQKESGDE